MFLDASGNKNCQSKESNDVAGMLCQVEVEISELMFRRLRSVS